MGDTKKTVQIPLFCTYKKSKKNHGQHSYEILTYKMDTSET